MEDRKPIASTLRGMRIGERAYFPHAQRCSVICTIQRIKFEGYQFTTITRATDLEVIKLKNP